MNQEVKEILYRQLQLLVEESAKTRIPEELCEYTKAMCGLADRLLSESVECTGETEYTIQAGSIPANRIIPWDGSILNCAQNAALME